MEASDPPGKELVLILEFEVERSIVNGLILNNIHKSFGEKQALAGVSFTIQHSEIFALLGPSGCGKSTLLSIIAGLVEPDKGEVFWKGTNLEGVPAYQRRFGLMFQDLALFPHLSVEKNIAFGLQMDGWKSPDVEKRVLEMLDLVNLSSERIRDVSTLSGGEKQRIALARTLAPMPELLMLDEPLGATDRTLRETLLLDLRRILEKLDQTVLYVTHDQEEAFAIADRVVILDAGKVMQTGTPRDVYQKPASTFVARFLGLNNLFKAEPLPEKAAMKTVLGEIPFRGGLDKPATVLLRPDAVQPGAGGPVTLDGELTACSFRGSICRSTIYIDGLTFTFDFPINTELPEPGSRMPISFDPDNALQVFYEK